MKSQRGAWRGCRLPRRPPWSGSDGKAAALGGYTGLRRDRFENKRVNKRVEIVVCLAFTHTGAKTFEVVSESGYAFVRSHVLWKMTEAEAKSSQENDLEQSRILPKNCGYRLIGTEAGEGPGHSQVSVTQCPREHHGLGFA